MPNCCRWRLWPKWPKIDIFSVFAVILSVARLETGGETPGLQRAYRQVFPTSGTVLHSSGKIFLGNFRRPTYGYIALLKRISAHFSSHTLQAANFEKFAGSVFDGSIANLEPPFWVDSKSIWRRIRPDRTFFWLFSPFYATIGYMPYPQ
jgi:hypothetical protein